MSINLARATVPVDYAKKPTGIGKVPVAGPVQVREPGSRAAGLGSALVRDMIGDHKHHGGTDQAVYAYAREQLDRWAQRLGRDLPGGAFGENLTTQGVAVDDAVIGERWRVGADVVLQVTVPRVPCNTFRGHMGERGWVKTFTADNHPGAYLRVITPGEIRAGDPIEVVHRPAHEVTIAYAFRAVMGEPALLPGLSAAGDDLPAELRRKLDRG